MSGISARMNLLVGVLWFSTLVALYVSAEVWRRRTLPGAGILLLLLLVIAHASFFHGLGLLAPDLAGKLWWNHVEYTLAVWLPGLMLTLALRHTRPERCLKPVPMALLFLLPLLALAANWTNGWHHLYYSSARLETSGTTTLLIKERGPLYWVFQAYALGTMLATSHVLLLHWQRSSRHYRNRSVALLLAAVTPLGMNVLYLLRVGPLPDVALTYLGFLATGLLLGWTLLRGNLLDLSPIARTVLLENMTEALLALNARGLIVDYNQKAAQWLGCTVAAVGQPARSLPGLETVQLELPQPASVTICVGARWVKLNSAPLCDAGGKGIGWLWLGQDITRQRKTDQALRAAYGRLRLNFQERTRELQRATAQSVRVQADEQERIGREIHDTLCQDLAGLSRAVATLAAQAQVTGPETLVADLRHAATQAAKTLQAARGFAHDLALVGLQDMPLDESLAAFAEHARTWLGVRVEINFDVNISIEEAEAAQHLLRIIGEAVANAARHGQARRAWVDIIRRGGRILVSVSNDGSPLPPDATLQAGLGLRAIRMRSRLLGGALTLRNTPDGMVMLQLELSEALLRLPSEERVPGLEGHAHTITKATP